MSTAAQRQAVRTVDCLSHAFQSYALLAVGSTSYYAVRRVDSKLIDAVNEDASAQMLCTRKSVKTRLVLCVTCSVSQAGFASCAGSVSTARNVPARLICHGATPVKPGLSAGREMPAYGLRTPLVQAAEEALPLAGKPPSQSNSPVLLPAIRQLQALRDQWSLPVRCMLPTHPATCRL